VIETLDDALEAVAKVGPVARQHAQKCEDSRQLAGEVHDAITDAGLWGVFTPKAAGGAGLGAPIQAFEVTRAMAYEDTSAGWAMLICAGTGGIAAARMSEEARKEVFGGGCVPLAGVFNPGGSATSSADGGFTVTGRWPFASGITYAQWVMANAIEVDESGAPKPGVVPGLPALVSTLVPRDDVTIVDDWHVAGLRGTGSMSFTMENRVIPAHRTFSFFGPTTVDEPAYRLPVLSTVAAYMAGMAVGLADRALDDVIALLPTRVGPPTFQPASADPLNQHVVGRAAAAIRGAREASRSILGRFTARLLGGEDLSAPTMPERAELHQNTLWVGEVCRDAINNLFQLGGANAIYEPNTLQRVWRDINVLNQHLYFRTTNHRVGGEIALGLEVNAPLF
jgi:alkylation response protein AidB-like acyl-CoA dehydrogenase